MYLIFFLSHCTNMLVYDADCYLQQELLWLFIEFLGVSIPARHSSSNPHVAAVFSHMTTSGTLSVPFLTAVQHYLSSQITDESLATLDPHADARRKFSPSLWGASTGQSLKEDFVYLWNCLPGFQLGWTNFQCPASMQSFAR